MHYLCSSIELVGQLVELAYSNHLWFGRAIETVFGPVSLRANIFQEYFRRFWNQKIS